MSQRRGSFYNNIQDLKITFQDFISGRVLHVIDLTNEDRDVSIFNSRMDFSQLAGVQLETIVEFETSHPRRNLKSCHNFCTRNNITNSYNELRFGANYGRAFPGFKYTARKIHSPDRNFSDLTHFFLFSEFFDGETKIAKLDLYVKDINLE